MNDVSESAAGSSSDNQGREPAGGPDDGTVGPLGGPGSATGGRALSGAADDRPGIRAGFLANIEGLGLVAGPKWTADAVSISRILEGIHVPSLLNSNVMATMSTVVAGMAKSIEPTISGFEATVAATTAKTVSAVLGNVVAAMELPRFELPDVFRQAWLWESYRIPTWPWDEIARTVAGLTWRLFPANLAPIEDLGLDELSALAKEGLTVWSVPRTKIAKDLLRAPTSQARRSILGDRWRAIVDDCDAAVEQQVGGPYGDQARLVQRAITAAKAGHTEAAQALVSSTLETVLQTAFAKPVRVQLTSHRYGRPDALDDLHVGLGLVMDAIWVAYRPYHTPSERAALPGFSRHGTTHAAGTRQLNRRNMVQATMLTTALITVLSEH